MKSRRREDKEAAALRAIAARRGELQAAIVDAYPKVSRVSVELGARAGIDFRGDEASRFQYAVKLYAEAHLVVDIAFPPTATDEEIQRGIDKAIKDAQREDLLPSDEEDEEPVRLGPVIDAEFPDPDEDVFPERPLADGTDAAALPRLEHLRPAPLDTFPHFVEHVRARLEMGRAFEATTPAVERSTGDLIGEIQDELADVCGWSACLWARLEQLKDRVAAAQEDSKAC